MHDKPVAFVTGANQGIGLQIAKELVASNFTVLVGSRDFGRGEEAAKTIDPAELDRCRDLGTALAAGLAAGIF